VRKPFPDAGFAGIRPAEFAERRPAAPGSPSGRLSIGFESGATAIPDLAGE